MTYFSAAADAGMESCVCLTSRCLKRDQVSQLASKKYTCLAMSCWAWSFYIVNDCCVDLVGECE